MPDQLTGMRVFARVAALGSLSGAARALGLSQTGITKHVAALEGRLGVRLLHRTTRRLTLTEAGRRYLEACERILPEIDEAEAEAAADQAEPRGTLRLNVPLSFGVRVVAPALMDFALAHPGLAIDLGLNDRVVDLVEEGWDAAIRVGTLRDSRLVARHLAPCRVLVCASPAYLAARGRPTRLADLAGHNCLGYTLGNELSANAWAFGAAGETVVPVAGTLRAANGDALLVAACAGLGLIYQPTFIVADAVRSGSLVALDLGQPTRVLAVHAMMPPGRRPPAKVRVLVDFLARHFAGIPPWDRDLPSPPGGSVA